ncbi:MAG: hypothetical protein FJ317_09065, partial [SAR202 cluster bacterium]|nr:hypothetical protein [SAR202 cluster bacterium]
RDATPLVMSVSGTVIEDVAACRKRLEPLCDGTEVNISSPNTAGLRVFQEPVELRRLLDVLNAGRTKPLFVKMPRSQAGDEGATERLLALVKTCVEAGVDGLTVANTRPVEDARLKVGRGGLSGRPLLEETLRLVKAVRDEAGAKPAINACGGITTGDDAFAALQAGATTVQVYTAMVYNGPLVVRDINRRLAALLGASRGAV